MTYNPNFNRTGPGAKKTKRVSDINALGISSQPVIKPPSSSSALPLNQDLHGIGSSTNYFSPNLNTLDQGFNPYQTPTINPQYDITQTTPNPNISQTGSFNQQFAMLQQPMVQDMAFQYGQKLADQGKDLVNKEFEKYVSVTKLKYYFAVDNRYVMSKLRLLFFPFAHRDWSLKYDQGEVAQPRDDINCPDLYIPLMGYITFIVMAGLILGMNERFSPEQLGIQASSALAYNIFELIIYTVTIYVTNIQTNLRTLDLVAYSGYKYASIVAILCGTITFSTTGYWILLIYCGFSLTFFLLRTLKAKVLSEPIQTAAQAPAYDSYSQQSQNQVDHTLGRKRKLYFLFMFAILQFLLQFILTKHLV